MAFLRPTSLAVLALLVCSISACVSAQSNATGQFGVTLNEKGFAFFGDEAVTVALAAAKGVQIPPISDQRFECGGKCYWSISDASIESVTCGSPAFTFVPGKGLSAKIPTCTAQASTNWRIKRSTFPPFSCSGGLSVTISNLNIGIELDVAVANDTLHLNVPAASVSLGDDKLHFSGDCKLLGDLAKKIIEKAVVEAINNKLSSQLPADINKALAAHPIPRYVDIGKSTRFDLGLPAAPSITADYLSLAFNGLFSPTAGGIYPGTKPALPTPSAPTNMVTVTLSEAVLNSLSWTLMTDGAFNLHLNKTIFGLELDVTVSAPSAPVVTFASTKPNTLATAAVALDAAITTPKTGADDISLALALNVPFNLKLDGQTLSGDINGLDMTAVNLTISLKSKTYGPFDPPLLEKIFTFLGDSIVLPAVNKKLQTGVQIPVFKGVGFADAVLTPGAGVLTVEASFAHVNSTTTTTTTTRSRTREGPHAPAVHVRTTAVDPFPESEDVIPVQVKFQK